MKLILKIIICLLIVFQIQSCKNSNKDEIMIELCNSSNEIYEEEINNLREVFKIKTIEEPRKYEDTSRELQLIEERVNKIKKNQDLKQKQILIQKLYSDFKLINEYEKIKIVSLNLESVNKEVYNSIVNNDLNKFLYLIYRKFYSDHHSMVF